jgi:hypothetical protein
MERNKWPLSAVPEGRDPGVVEAIRRRAYELWEAEGRPQGHERDHWLQAELEILGQAPPMV